MGDVWDSVSDTVGDFVGIVSDVYEGVTDFVVDIGVEVVQGTIEAIDYFIPGSEDVIYDGMEFVVDLFTEVADFLDPVIDVIVDVFDFSFGGIEEVEDSLTGMLEEIAAAELAEYLIELGNLGDVWDTVQTTIITEIADYGESRGFDRYVIPLILRITRNHVLQVSSLFGRSYGTSEAEWISQLHKILLILQGLSLAKSKDISHIFKVIDKAIYEPYSDSKGALARSWVLLFDGLLNKSNESKDSIENMQAAVDDILNKIPSQIKDEVKPEVGKLKEWMNVWINTVWADNRSIVREVLDVLTGQTNQNRSDIAKVVDRILNPAKYLEEIDNQAPEVLADSEDTIADISHRQIIRDAAALDGEVGDVYDKLDKDRALGVIPVVVKSWDKPKVADIKPKPVEPMEPRLTWYVGEF